MKQYKVVITEDALEQARKYLLYRAIDQQQPETAAKWWHKALEAVETLSSFPQRCGYADENQWSDNELRALRVDRCLFIYHVDEDDRKVEIVKFRHGSQQAKPLR